MSFYNWAKDNGIEIHTNDAKDLFIQIGYSTHTIILELGRFPFMTPDNIEDMYATTLIYLESFTGFYTSQYNNNFYGTKNALGAIHQFELKGILSDFQKLISKELMS